MEVRYIGFDQSENARAYRFEVACTAGERSQFVVVADLRLFLLHRVGIQEGPSLCACKLATDIENERADFPHELTADDLRAYADARSAAAAKKAESRKSSWRPAKAASQG